MDADHSGTVTEAEARKALKNRMPPVTSAAGNAEEISMTSGDPGSESDVFFYRGWSWQVGPNSDGLGGPKNLPVLLENEWHEWLVTGEEKGAVVALIFWRGDTGCVTYSRFMAEMIAAKKAGGDALGPPQNV